MKIDEIRNLLIKATCLVNDEIKKITNKQVDVFASLGYGKFYDQQTNVDIFKSAASVFVTCDERKSGLVVLSVFEVLERHSDLVNKFEYFKNMRKEFVEKISVLVCEMHVDENLCFGFQTDQFIEEELKRIKDVFFRKFAISETQTNSYGRMIIGNVCFVKKLLK